MKFSDRVGVTKPEDVVQVNSINEDLRTSLWNVLTACYWDKFDKNKYDGSGYGGRLDYISASNLSGLFNHLWLSYFKKPIDKMPLYFFDSDGGLSVLRDYFFGSEWYEVYNFLEFICDFGPSDFRSKFVKTSNFILEREKSGYRFVDGKLIEISSVEEVAEIVNAIEQTPYYGVKQHLTTAVSHLSNRANPDYRNSIKESISAVESLCKSLTKNENAELSDALNVLKKNGKVHPALQKAFTALYGYTSDAEGIRHALLEESILTSDDARFMLISCSAFINYLIAKRET